MTKTLLMLLSVVFLCTMVADANACYKHGNSKWAMHYAGPHNREMNTCAYSVTDCSDVAGQVVVNAPMNPGRCDIYILALDTNGIAGTRYGVCCSPSFENFYFYGWASCSDFEIPTSGWPGCGEGNAQTWIVEQPPGHVTLGILDVYVYTWGEAVYLGTCDDPRAGFAVWCDGSSPQWCCDVDYDVYPAAFGYVGFGMSGYNPCGVVPVERTSWGTLKTLYR